MGIMTKNKTQQLRVIPVSSSITAEMNVMAYAVDAAARCLKTLNHWINQPKLSTPTRKR